MPPRDPSWIGTRSATPAWTLLAALLALLPAGPLSAQPGPDLYRARLARPAPVADVTVGGVEWSCEGVTCLAESSRPLTNVKACGALASEVGRVSAFGPSGAAGLDAEELALCNRAAGVAGAGDGGGGADDPAGDRSDGGDGDADGEAGEATPETVVSARDTAAARVAPGVPRFEVLRSTCVPLELTVDAGGEGQGRFRSLRAALRRAAESDACAVRVRLGAGEHAGSVRVDRDTEIVGPDRGRAVYRGTLSNRGPHRLAVRGVHLRGAGRPGAVSVDHPRARTELRLLTVSGARGIGVRQRGGRLVLDRVNVFATAAVPGSSGSGAGVLLEDGADARLDGVTLAGNETGGLVLRGPGTLARARRLRVLRTGAGASGVGGPAPGAVRVSEGATLLARGPRLDENAAAGLHVRNGGRAHLRGGRVRRTRTAGERSGVNVVVDGGTAVLRDVTLSDADLAGLVVAGGGSVSLVEGTVSRNAIGVALRSPHPLRCLRRGTAFRDNEINLETATPPVPGDATGDDSVPCARVPWRWP